MKANAIQLGGDSLPGAAHPARRTHMRSCVGAVGFLLQCHFAKSVNDSISQLAEKVHTPQHAGFVSVASLQMARDPLESFKHTPQRQGAHFHLGQGRLVDGNRL
jgi:hypothetical protein